MAHGIFRSDSCSYTHDGALIRTGVAYGDIDNGAPIKVTTLVTNNAEPFYGEREVFKTATANGANAADVWVVTSPEHAYTTEKKPLENFFNSNGDIIRVSKLVKCDIFSITDAVVSGTPSPTNAYINATDGGWTATSTANADKNFAKYLATEIVGGTTMYVYEVL